MATCTSEQANAIAMDINVALDEYMPFSVETDYLMGGLIQQSGRAQFPSSPDEFVGFFDERDHRLERFDSVVEEWGHCLNNMEVENSRVDSMEAYQASYVDQIEAQKALAPMVRECSLETFDITGCIESLLGTSEWERFEGTLYGTDEAKQEALEEGAYSEGPDIDALVEQALAGDALGGLGISESEVRCAVTATADAGEYNRSELQAAFSSDEPLRPFLRHLLKALDQCADLRTVLAAMVAPELGVTVDFYVCTLEQISDEILIDVLVAFAFEADLGEGDPALADLEREIEAVNTTACVEDWEEEIRSGLVEILIERGMTPEAAEIEADERMAEGTEAEVVEDQFDIWDDWMVNYPSHPVLGDHWTADEAECVIIDMMKKRGIYETERQIKGATLGGMDEEDAEFLVRPVADCVDLRAAFLDEMVMYEYHEDPECGLAGVTEEQIASWYVANFTDGWDGFRELYLRDINQSC